MFEATSDSLRQAQSNVPFKTWTSHADASRIQPGTTDPGEAFDRIARQPRYRHFARIPARILRCLDYFQVRGDRIAAARVLGAYYIFIGVVDKAIDSSEPRAAAMVFEQLAGQLPISGSEVAIATEHLKRQLDNETGATLRTQLGLLYETVCREPLAVSIEEYVEVRKAVGRLTADLSYFLIRPLLDDEHQALRAFMQRVGAVGCLVDSVIDLRADQRRGLVGFTPGNRGYLKLWLTTLREGLSIGLRHPRLAGLFTYAILDSVRDRFISASDSMNGKAEPQVLR
jgi:hypothetical protein